MDWFRRSRSLARAVIDMGHRIDRDMRQKHPNLWRAIVLDIVCMFGAGIGYTFLRTPPSFSRYIPVEAIGVGLIASSLMLLYGFRYNIKWYGRAMALGAGVCTFLTISVGGSIIYGYVTGSIAPPVGSFFMFLFVTCQLLLQSAEPLTNPTSEAGTTEANKDGG